MSESIYTISKGSEKVSLADKESAKALVAVLMDLDCTEPVSKTVINGNRQQLARYEITFDDKSLKALSLADDEKIMHWLLGFGLTKISIERLRDDRED